MLVPATEPQQRWQPQVLVPATEPSPHPQQWWQRHLSGLDPATEPSQQGLQQGLQQELDTKSGKLIPAMLDQLLQELQAIGSPPN